MNADQVRAFVATCWPNAMQSPSAHYCAAFAAAEEADRTVDFASLQARVTGAERKRVLDEAAEHAEACLTACGGWTVETLGHNIESAMAGELDDDECDGIASQALRRFA